MEHRTSGSITDLHKLWFDYGHRPRPANIGDRIEGVLIGELDDEIQDVVSTYFGMGLALGPERVARLGIALAELTRILPHIAPPATANYFRLVEALARGTLEAVVRGESPGFPFRL